MKTIERYVVRTDDPGLVTRRLRRHDIVWVEPASENLDLYVASKNHDAVAWDLSAIVEAHEGTVWWLRHRGRHERQGTEVQVL